MNKIADFVSLPTGIEEPHMQPEGVEGYRSGHEALWQGEYDCAGCGNIARELRDKSFPDLRALSLTNTWFKEEALTGLLESLPGIKLLRFEDVAIIDGSWQRPLHATTRMNLKRLELEKLYDYDGAEPERHKVTGNHQLWDSMLTIVARDGNWG
ncbi:hypothetical protein M011DRAFT_472466 [Sporormia fimetaria CBS 119925]|uniref:Uncharacterized protein n=1 Tax=Sporormia fimetaria CBS 119925 TaxID=1340428 RepID=A0A6A6UXD4_9PLEO|nr:hypothetical protein M011DRAFT_472466 [Sporormia fimetaria CBS 119925]